VQQAIVAASVDRHERYRSKKHLPESSGHHPPA
jgi:hypothetical protein